MFPLHLIILLILKLALETCIQNSHATTTEHINGKEGIESDRGSSIKISVMLENF